MLGWFGDDIGMITVLRLRLGILIIIYDWSVIVFPREDNVWEQLAVCTDYYLWRLGDWRRRINHGITTDN